jgi:hypothetical protein
MWQEVMTLEGDVIVRGSKPTFELFTEERAPPYEQIQWNIT